MMGFDGIRPGDRVTVSWPGGAKPAEGYCSGGVVVQMTERLVAIRAPEGYCFCVTKNQVAAGASLFAVKKGGGGR
ncbi:hypothetical protein [Thermodesulfitimonas autotrophica]|nr:hypothetical protein [Thermodesulfitimonas autotrophica]